MQVFPADNFLCRHWLRLDPVAVTVVAAALVAPLAGVELAVALEAWVQACLGAAFVYKLWLFPTAAQWWSWGKGPTQVQKLVHIKLGEHIPNLHENNIETIIITKMSGKELGKLHHQR